MSGRFDRLPPNTPYRRLKNRKGTTSLMTVMSAGQGGLPPNIDVLGTEDHKAILWPGNIFIKVT